ncbi:ABC-three component system middle component 2 [Aminobacter sp. AP02]|uniref:ABC-three component system middle component 2 n=1 Tax=Aminobacter sp. AP02 TaxID=2135737 RepID=UPI000D6BE5E6|nr:ABC-three component system middle component 2 [Aminobacter sp. AP02]PWK63681.1 hypothetical protein C8K44_1232 [Aminobacter sp. AP02]
MEALRETGRKGCAFNSPLETGIRSVGVLAALYPKAFDLQRMVAFDYLVVHTADVGGPASLHPDLPLRSAELLVRRELVERGLHLMMSRKLVDRAADTTGIVYRAGEMADVFFSTLTSEYMSLLQLRAQWVAEVFGDMGDDQFRMLMRENFDKWVEQFHVIQKSSVGGAS